MTFRYMLAAVAAFLSVGVIGGGALAQRPTPVIIVDQQKVLSDSAAVKSITEQVQALTQTLNAELTQQGETIQAEAQALQASRESLSKEEFQKRAQALSQKELDYIVEQQIAQATAQKARDAAFGQLSDPLQEAVSDIAKRKKNAVVLDSTMVVFPGKAEDVTSDVLDALNKRIQTVKVEQPKVTAEQRQQVRQQIQQQLALRQYEAAGRQQLLALGQRSLAAQQQTAQ